MGDTPIPSAVVDEMISFIRDTATARYCMLAATVLYVYDLVTTLDKEVDLVWTRSRSFLQVLYIINRYVALFDCLFNSSVFLYQGTNLTNSLCENWLKFQSGAAIVIVTVVQTILVIRLWAMYGRNRWILISITTFGTLQLIANAIIMGKSINYASATAHPVPGFVVCATALPPYFAACWIPILAFEITLLALMLVKGWQNFRRQNVTAVSGMTGKSLANLLVRDSIIYFVVINAAYVANAAVCDGGCDAVDNYSSPAHGEQAAP
ncbi:hypothetical protein BJ138DRAFT_1131240 [Hygrophoropsis aurantiaca]|uniref:Uncharacterized protein n=1 Tax=Hygrophoropsis aurantiaca TaxID=72124 RepID=A0ACB7ZSX0_9AGAM|nr:hypothetical protein BJ138DRAFT_1131240 [Hygrophoropsis aurantiaca]